MYMFKTQCEIGDFHRTATNADETPIIRSYVASLQPDSETLFGALQKYLER